MRWNLGPEPADPAATRWPASPGRWRLTSGEPEIRPFRAGIAEEAGAGLRRRIAATRFPGKELVADQSQGTQLAAIQELAHCWATEYDWRACEAGLNALPQFITEIDGVDIHFIHVKSRHENALPLIITNGWPGSVIGRQVLSQLQALGIDYGDATSVPRTAVRPPSMSAGRS